MENLITVKLVDLIGKDISGLTAQVRNPIYLNEQAQVYPMWRTLKNITTYKERGEMWLQMEWVKKDEVCSFTGCTIASNHCQLQMTKEVFECLPLTK